MSARNCVYPQFSEWELSASKISLWQPTRYSKDSNDESINLDATVSSADKSQGDSRDSNRENIHLDDRPRRDSKSDRERETS